MESKFSGAVALDRKVKENKEHFPYQVYLKHHVKVSFYTAAIQFKQAVFRMFTASPLVLYCVHE